MGSVDFTMKAVVAFLLVLSSCLVGADDIRSEFRQFKRQLEGQCAGKYAELASRLSASETKVGELVEELHKHKTELASRLSASETKVGELVEELHKHKTGSSQRRNGLMFSELAS